MSIDSPLSSMQGLVEAFPSSYIQIFELHFADQNLTHPSSCYGH